MLTEQYNYYNPKLKDFAHDLRNRMTKAEVCLWKYALRAKQMSGYTFNRQRPVLHYIADFMCKDLKLIIEVDGITHTWPTVIEKDIKRQRELEQAGFTVLRFRDEEVLNQMQSVRRVISDTIAKLEAGK
jgi:very-short-patch-repair endonuclease